MGRTVAGGSARGRTYRVRRVAGPEPGLAGGAGVIPWQFNESYPNAWGTSAVDHRGDPKPAYWGVARAYAPDAVSAQFPTPAIAR